MHHGKAMLGLAAAGGIALVFVLGCGDADGLGRRYPVHGRVMYRSQPLEIGRITFYPIDVATGARPAPDEAETGASSMAKTQKRSSRATP